MRIKTLLIMLFFLVPLTIKAEPRVTDIGAAKYYTSEVVEENNLPNGVIHYAHKGFTSAKEGEVTDMGMNVTETFVPDKFYPQTINMLEIPASSNVKLIPWAVIEDSGWKLKTVREIAADFEKHHPGKKVIAGVNGDFFDIQGGKMYPYTPHSAHASEGNHFKSITQYRALGFKNDHSTTPLVGNTPIERNALPTLEILNEFDEVVLSFPIDKVNEEPSDLELSLIYPKYGILTNGASPKSQPVNVENAFLINATHALPITNVQAVHGYESDSLDFYGKGIVERFGDGVLLGNSFALKTDNQEVKDALKIHTNIRVQYNYTGAFEGVDNIIGYNQIVMYNKEKVHSITQRAPRTMVGVKADGTVMLTIIDGRRPDANLYGAAMAEMRAVMTHYGAVDAYNLDGGGSSTMVILDETLRVTNTISDAFERRDANALLVVMDIPEVDLSSRIITDHSVEFKPEIKALNGYSLDDLYIHLNDTYEPLSNPKFQNLTKEMNYAYELFHKVGDTYQTLYTKGVLTTAKIAPVFHGISLGYRNNDVLIELHLSDPDKTFLEGQIKVGETIVSIVNNIAILRDFKGKTLNDLEVIILVDTHNEMGVAQLMGPYKQYKSTEYIFNESFNEYMNQINSILGGNE